MDANWRINCERLKPLWDDESNQEQVLKEASKLFFALRKQASSVQKLRAEALGGIALFLAQQSLSQVRDQALYARYSGVSLKDFRSSLAIGRALPGINDRETRSGQQSPAVSRTPTRSSNKRAATTTRTPTRSTGSGSEQPDVTPTRTSSRLSNASKSSARKAARSSPTKQSAAAAKKPEPTPDASRRETSASQRARNDLMDPLASSSSKRAREVEPEESRGSPSKVARTTEASTFRTTPTRSRVARTNTPLRRQLNRQADKEAGEATPRAAAQQEEAEEARLREADRMALDAADAEEAARAQRIRQVPRVPWDFELGQAKWDEDEEEFEAWRQSTFASLRARQVMV